MEKFHTNQNILDDCNLDGNSYAYLPPKLSCITTGNWAIFKAIFHSDRPRLAVLVATRAALAASPGRACTGMILSLASFSIPNLSSDEILNGQRFLGK